MNYIFKVSGGGNFENYSAWRQPSWDLRGFDVCTGLPKKSLDTSLKRYIIQGVSQKRPPKINRNISSNNPLLYKKNLENLKCNSSFLRYN